MSLFAAFAAEKTNKSVTPLNAETVTTSWLSLEAASTISSTNLMLFALATDVPPNFKIFIIVFLKNICFDIAIQSWVFLSKNIKVDYMIKLYPEWGRSCSCINKRNFPKNWRESSKYPI